MKRLLAITAGITLLAGTLAQAAGPFEDGRLLERTLRVDYSFAGTDKTCDISVAELLSLEGWAGRRVNLDTPPLRGNGQITMRDASSGEVLYANSFSTLFQEWQATEEATRVRRSFENVFLLPMPAVPVEITVQLFDFHDNVAASLTHPVDPKDILIRPVPDSGAHYQYILQNGSAKECIDVAILAEGYTLEEMDTFYADARRAVDSILSHEPFGKMADRFNFIAVGAPSEDSGVSVPRDGIWCNTVVNSHFDTFYTERYLTTLHLKQLHDVLAGLPYEHIIILANTDTYGGGGIFNSYTLTTAHHPLFEPVVVHEFGHSFGGLADEYYYDDQYVNYYYPDVEPWEQNITTKADFASKWKDMVEAGSAGLIEGGGYMSKGVWRGAETCRMKDNVAGSFCPVCQRALEDIIRFNTDEL